MTIRARRPLRHSALLSAAALIAGTAVGLTATTASAATPTVRLTGDVLTQLIKQTDLGPTSTGRHIQVDVTLARPNPGAENAYYRALYTKGSGRYHQFLTPAQFDARFGVAQADFECGETRVDA